MKNFLTLILCWLLAFSAIAETTFKAKTAASVAGGYVTSLNKVDGSFEDESTQWSASVGTIVPTASTEFQGNNIGVWAGTGTGTLNLQWTATASNTYEASAQVDVQGEDDVYICAYVGTTETGCKLIPALSKIQKVSVVADSVMSSAFYLRLKHTGSDAFSVKVDDGKIEPWTPQTVNLVEQESVAYTGHSTGTNPIVFLTRDSQRSNERNLIEVSTVGVAGTASKYKILKPANFSVTSTVYYSSTGGYYTVITHFDSANNVKKRSILNPPTGSASGVAAISGKADVGDYFTVATNATPSNVTDTFFSITASAISENVVQSYAPSDFLGEIKLLPSTTAPKGFIPADGKSIGKTSGNYQGDAYYALYALRWAMASTTAGEPYVISSAKGASAQADWDAGKTITIDVRGMFFRAAGGNAGAVGSKQLDAFQGHGHGLYSDIYGNYPTASNMASASGNSFGFLDTSGTSVPNGNFTAKGYVDVGYSTPRFDYETRPINTSEYAYMRYGNDAPTLLALPNGTETNYSITATGNAAQVITANVTDIPFIATTQNNLVWSGSSFTSPTDSIYQISASINLSANTGNAFEYYINGSRVGRLYSQATGVSSIFPFSTTIAVPANSTFSIRSTVNATLSNTADHRLQITRVNGKIDKTFVGNVAKNQIVTVEGRTSSAQTIGTSATTLILNSLVGDSTIATLSSNQITLQAGEYDVQWNIPVFSTSAGLGASGWNYNYLYNVTDASEVRRGDPAFGSTSVSFMQSNKMGNAKLMLTAAKVFELRSISTQSAGFYVGTGGSSPNDLASWVKITKLNGQ